MMVGSPPENEVHFDTKCVVSEDGITKQLSSSDFVISKKTKNNVSKDNNVIAVLERVSASLPVSTTPAPAVPTITWGVAIVMCFETARGPGFPVIVASVLADLQTTHVSKKGEANLAISEKSLSIYACYVLFVSFTLWPEKPAQMKAVANIMYLLSAKESSNQIAICCKKCKLQTLHYVCKIAKELNVSKQGQDNSVKKAPRPCSGCKEIGPLHNGQNANVNLVDSSIYQSTAIVYVSKVSCHNGQHI